MSIQKREQLVEENRRGEGEKKKKKRKEKEKKRESGEKEKRGSTQKNNTKQIHTGWRVFGFSNFVWFSFCGEKETLSSSFEDMRRVDEYY